MLSNQSKYLGRPIDSSAGWLDDWDSTQGQEGEDRPGDGGIFHASVPATIFQQDSVSEDELEVGFEYVEAPSPT
jgi:hypothetical protein